MVKKDEYSRFLSIKPIETQELRKELCKLANLNCDNSEKYDNGMILTYLEKKVIEANQFENAIYKTQDELKSKGLYN